MGWSSWLAGANRSEGSTGGVGLAWKPYLDIMSRPRRPTDDFGGGQVALPPFSPIFGCPLRWMDGL
eukprot:12824120-Prorocentrum_lima.AAC.1